ncbi:MAG: 6-phosphogluconolactonase/glucosamine-6-phosphate isomerase/deaminase [Parvicellaceae bacterium]|jgi:6-phosphogluconolactonase/glucosamine-6-phosphate isomerase/deaminase
MSGGVRKSSVEDHQVLTNSSKTKSTSNLNFYKAPKTVYAKSKKEFDSLVCKDFIERANQGTKNETRFIVGLSHGISPAGVYQEILNNYSKLKHPELIKYTFVNSRLKSQRELKGTLDAISFVKTLYKTGLIEREQVLGSTIERDNLDVFAKEFDKRMKAYLLKHGKDGLDYVFIASNSKGQVAGITRNSSAFKSQNIVEHVLDTEEPEITFTPAFISKSKRISFLATKAEKRRTLAWLYYRWGKAHESPSFLRHIENVENRLKVFIDHSALTWPQEILTRKTKYGDTTIRLDLAETLVKEKKDKRPVIIFIHGFLGLNTFDSMLAFISIQKYIAAAMHYGSIPYDLPPKDYSQFVVENINHVVNHFGKMGHPVYIFDHSMANTYMLMIDQQMDNLSGIKKYLKGRIAANPFFGLEVRHTSEQFMDQVVLTSELSTLDRSIFKTVRKVMPLMSKNRHRNTGIMLSEWLIRRNSNVHRRIWKAIKKRIFVLITDNAALPELNRVPIEYTLNRLPIKIFAIQLQCALRESKKFDNVTRLRGFENNQIPILVLKSNNDPIAKFVSSTYDSTENVTISDITNDSEQEKFREHLYYMIHPEETIKAIYDFLEKHKS